MIAYASKTARQNLIKAGFVKGQFLFLMRHVCIYISRFINDIPEQFRFWFAALLSEKVRLRKSRRITPVDVNIQVSMKHIKLDVQEFVICL